jgi:protoporphyrinogen oxidase
MVGQTNITTLILGGGISGLSFAHFYKNVNTDYLILEKEETVGGLCRSFKKGEFVFDFSGHFLHFKNSDMRQCILELSKSTGGKFTEHTRKAGIFLQKNSRVVTYPFQANIHELDREDFLHCLSDLYFAQRYKESTSFEETVRNLFGDGITNLFFKPYNEKLYRTELSKLDSQAMSRFIPKVDVSEIIKNFTSQKEFGYNQTFLYDSENGIQSIVNAFKPETLNISHETVSFIDIKNKIVRTDKGNSYTYSSLVNTLPLNIFAKLAGLDISVDYVSVDVYNIGLNEKSAPAYSWLYFPDSTIPFYRVGFYNYFSNIDKTSLYVEVARKEGDKKVSNEEILKALKENQIIAPDSEIEHIQNLTISPAYVILHKDTEAMLSVLKNNLLEDNIHLLGRYGSWSYSSIEDNILDALQLAKYKI